MIKRIKSGIAGKSFGFDYLEWIRKMALGYGLKGIAFLKKDGTIEVIAEGEEKSLLKLANKLSTGGFWHSIENFYIDWMNATGEYPDFFISLSEDV